MDRWLQGFDRKISSISQIFDTLVCTTRQYGFVMLILLFLTSIHDVLDAAFDLFASRHTPRLYTITSNEAFHADFPDYVVLEPTTDY